MRLRAPPPSGFAPHSLPCGSGWLRPEWSQHIAKAVGNSRSPLIELAAASERSRSFRGRSRVASWKLPGLDRQLVVRRCGHGGLWRRFAGDRYVGDFRARIEIDNARRIGELGVATPEIAGVMFYKSGIFRRIDFITVLVENGEDLVEFLKRNPAPERRKRGLDAVRALLEKCAAGGMRHRDLNARNILLACGGDSVSAYVLDVEDVAWNRGHAAAVRQANFDRLRRSLHKQARHGMLVQECAAAAIAALEPRP